MLNGQNPASTEPGAVHECGVSAHPWGCEGVPRLLLDRVGMFTSPVLLPGWLLGTLTVAGVVAAVERALTWRHHRVVDAETLWTSL